MEENYLIGGVNAMIFTDDRGIYFPRLKVYNHSIYSDEEVVFLHNSDFSPKSPIFEDSPYR